MPFEKHWSNGILSSQNVRPLGVGVTAEVDYATLIVPVSAMTIFRTCRSSAGRILSRGVKTRQEPGWVNKEVLDIVSKPMGKDTGPCLNVAIVRGRAFDWRGKQRMCMLRLGTKSIMI